MKRSKKLTRDQKEELTKKGFDAKKFRFVEEDGEAWLFVNMETAERVWIPKKY